MGLPYGIGQTDDIDHLGNRRIRSVGELLQNQIRVGLSRMERVVRERMGIYRIWTSRPRRPHQHPPGHSGHQGILRLLAAVQFMDQTNPLAELTHKRRLSALGPGGLNRERASFEVRDVHYSPLRPHVPDRDA